jgi:hypothetical protein
MVLINKTYIINNNVENLAKNPSNLCTKEYCTGLAQKRMDNIAFNNNSNARNIIYSSVSSIKNIM